MLVAVVAAIKKSEEATKEAAVLLNPEAAVASSPVDVVTFNRLVAEEISLATKAVVVEVSNLENTEAEEALKAAVEAKRWETVGVVSAIMLTVIDKDPVNLDLREEVMESPEINTGPTMNPHQSQSSRAALVEEAPTQEVEENPVTSQKNNTKDPHKTMLIAEMKAIKSKTPSITSKLPMKNLGMNNVTMSSGLTKNTSPPIEMTSMSNLPAINRTWVAKVITSEEEIEAEAVVVVILNNPTTEVATILNTKTTINAKDMAHTRMTTMKTLSPRITVVEEGTVQNAEVCGCAVGSKTEAEVIEEPSEDTAVAIKKEAAIKLAVDTVAIEATSEEGTETSMEKEVASIPKEVEHLNEAAATATTKASQKIKQNISTAIKMENSTRSNSRREVQTTKLTEEESNLLSIGSAKR